jgi:hypothetical protein
MKKRNDTVQEAEARALYEATADTGSGVMQWIRGKW